jgi:hypothetical protein
VTITSAFTTITSSIAALSISGVTIKDVDEIPQSARLLCPVLLPQPNDFVTDFAPTFQTFGSNGTPKIDLEYTLHYVYLHCEAGAGLSQLEIYSGLMTKLSAILVALLSNDAVTGLVDMKPEIGNIGVIEDPTGTQYWGILISLRILEFAQ